MSAPIDQDGTRHAKYARKRRAELATHLKEIKISDDTTIKVSEHPDCPHGTRDGYDLYGCRCAACGEHSAAPRIKEYREKRYQAAAVAVLHGQGVPRDDAPELAAELIELWRNSRTDSRLRKLATRISQTKHGLTGAHAIVTAEALIAALRTAGSGSKKAEDLPARSQL